jgi:hypothetical protein
LWENNSRQSVLNSVVTNEQLYLAIGIPMLFNAALIGLLNAKMDAKFEAVYARLDAIDKRFDDMRDLWRAEPIGSKNFWTPA